MRAQDAVGGGVGKDFHKAVGLEHRLGAGVAHEGKFADLVGTALIFKLFFRRADRGDFGCGIDHAGDDGVVHMAMFARNNFGQCHAFVLSLMGQHRAGYGVAYGVKTGDVGGVMGIGFDRAARTHLDPQGFKPKASGIGLAPCCQQDDIRNHRRFGPVGAGFVGGGGARNTLHRCAQNEVEALFGQDLLEGLLHLCILARGDDIKIFDHSYLGAQTSIDRAEFQPNHTRADHSHGGGNLRQGQSAGGRDNLHLVHRDTRQAGGFRACGDDDVAGLVQIVAHLHLTGGGDRAPAFQPRDLVFLEQKLDPLGVAAYDISLIGLHLGPIDLGGGPHQAHLFKVFMHFVQVMRGVQQRL